MEHGLLRYLKEKSTGNFVGMCHCGGIYPLVCDELDHRTPIDKKDTEEITMVQTNLAPAPEQKAVS